MEFRNHTPFPALAFEGIDQFDRAFHVVVLRQTLTWGADGHLIYAEEQEPLCEVDAYFGPINRSSLRQESDLCHYKPRCDVLLNATAHAPPGAPLKRFDVRLVLSQPDTDAPIPERPQGLNQFVEPDAAALAAWREAVAHAQADPVQGRRLLNKTLTVTGERELVRSGTFTRMLASIARVCSLGLFNGGRWRLTSPKPVAFLPLRYEYAYGGECRIAADDPRAKRLRDGDRLAASQTANDHPSGGAQAGAPAALAAFESNAVGRGYGALWFLEATRIKRLPAPQIEPVGEPCTVARFVELQDVKAHTPNAVSSVLAGFGVRAKTHPERRKLCGTIDQRFAKNAAWLPEDFDFAAWNAAPPDQQTDFLRGDEYIELTNLCRTSTHGAFTNATGDTVLRLTLPGHASTLLVRMANGTMFFHPMKIDTLIIEPEDRKVSLVWRAVLEKTTDIRAVEAHLHKEAEIAFSRHLDAELEKLAADELLASMYLPPEDHHG